MLQDSTNQRESLKDPKEEKPKVVSALTETKSFSYHLDGVDLNFTLRIDTRKEMEAFVTVLYQATVDVNKQLAIYDSRL